MFPFPSNGKAYPKRVWHQLALRLIQNVSIPFQRESISKVQYLFFMQPCRWVSIPFQRESISKVYQHVIHRRIQWLFPFPSNGKAYPKGIDFSDWSPEYPRVSIPFQRESISKDTWATAQRSGSSSFHSLPTGKHIQSFLVHDPRLIHNPKFPFPSNGKAYPKLYKNYGVKSRAGFHSLPTGKHIQSRR